MSRRHDHEFAGAEGNIETAENVYISERCQHEQILNSYTDDVRDETYYETGPQCETTRHITYERVEETYDGEPIEWATLDAETEQHIIDLENEGLEQCIVEEGRPRYGESSWQNRIVFVNGPLRIVFEKAEEYLDP